MSSLPDQFRILEEFLASLNRRLESLEELIRRCCESITVISDEKKAEQKIHEEIATQISLLSTPKQEKEADRSDNERRHGDNLRIQRWTMRGTWFTGACTLLAFGAAAYYAYQARKQSDAMNKTYCEIQKQTKVMRQQLVGTQAAVIILGSSPSWTKEKKQLGFQIDNSGQVIGKLLSFDAIIKFRSLPSQSIIGAPIKVRASGEEIARGQPFVIYQTLPWVLPEVKDADHWPGDQFVTIDGTFSYDDGFGDTYSHTFCYIWMAQWAQNMPVPSMGGWSGGGWGWGSGHEPCRTVRDMENEFKGIKQHIKEASTPQH